MELFTACLLPSNEQEVWKLSRYLSEAFAPLHMAAGSDILGWDIDAEKGRISCFELPGNSSQSLARADVIRQAAKGIADYILYELEPALLRSLLHKESGYTDTTELQKIESISRELLYGENHEPLSINEEQLADWRKRHNKISEELGEFLSLNTTVHVHGFITFRLASYWDTLRETAEYAIDEYVMEKQYQDFISLLRYFVAMQDTKTSVVHLFQMDDGQFQLCNSQLLPLEYRNSDRIVADMLEAEMNVEDRVVSTLIAASPRQILIHTRSANQQVIRTIESIFGDRVQVCSGCGNCSRFFEQMETAGSVIGEAPYSSEI
ncbi:putative sporulation protein YtxC [Paenibacillus roseus]|uniref:Sporulation protein YtxC n=1 Tax=Paenibacillus roseus TaxID=2798579 RepID=A0A934J7L4_9BACL|nr:putative sporulation protein YtxC [Paenibacillus roseus]MBJ6362211.1 putative sporulation protein YtxC [Paenibacillus roseus]